MNDILQDLSEPILIEKIETNTIAFLKELHHVPGVESYIGPNIIWFSTDIPMAFFNSICAANLKEENVDSTIQQIIEQGQSKNTPRLWWTGPLTKPENITKSLEAYGFMCRETNGMAIDLSEMNEEIPKIPDFEIKEVEDTETLKLWSQAFKVGYGMPDAAEEVWTEHIERIGYTEESLTRIYVGCLKGDPVASSLVYYGEGVAGIYSVGTSPEARGQGIGTAITMAPLIAARKRGYRVSTLQSTPMGFNVYKRIGYKEYCKIGLNVWRPPKKEEE